MAENIGRSKGRGRGYTFDRGGMPTERGPYVGTVMQNVDNTRTGRLRVFIQEFGDGTPTPDLSKTNPSLWRTVRYLSPFYGLTPQGATGEYGKFVDGNSHTYGMWFTAPDIGTKVLCFFVDGDPDKGYYVGCLPEDGLTHMIPAIGSTQNYQVDNDAQKDLFADAEKLPVIEINNANQRITNNPKFFNALKPVHSVVAASLFQQGLIKDPVRGIITSSSQRESPSNVFGFSTPGRPIYQGGENQTSQENIETGQTSATSLKIIGRQGGHTLVFDDGDVKNKNNLIRIRTSKGHQITMSDDGNCFYITHANGLAWIELGKEGTVDVYSTNSVNVRTRGTINLHADKDINMFAGGKINVKSDTSVDIEAATTMTLQSVDTMTVYSKATIGVKSDGSLAIQSDSGSWDGGSELAFEAGKIKLNSGGAESVTAPDPLTVTTLPDTEFKESEGWVVVDDALKSIVTRAPTHEPYPGHNTGITSATGTDAGTGDDPLTDDEVLSSDSGG